MNSFGNTGMPTWQKALFAIIGVAFVITLAAVAFLYIQNSNLKKDPNAETKAETKELVAKVGKHYDLPTDETPTVATVSDKSKVADQPFFAKAENGDKILIYRKNKLAILYRPSEDRLINVGPIDLDAASGTSTGTATASVAKVGLYNAGTASGLTAAAEPKLTGASFGSKLAIAEKKNATTKSTGKIIVVDVSGGHGELASSIASTLGGDVGSLPAGEPKPGVDIAVYLGK